MTPFQRFNVGTHVATESWVHSLDPRTKLGATILLMASTMLVRTMGGYLILIAFLLVVTRLSQLPFSILLGNVRSFIWLLVITFFLHLWFTPGERTGISPLGVPLTLEGVSNGLFFCMRIMILILLATLLTMTTSPMELADGMGTMLRPFRRIGVPADELAIMLMISLRFIPTLIDEAETLRKAQLARGASLGGNIIKRARSLIPLVVPLFVSAFRRADDLALAMEARCYTGGGRTHLQELKIRSADLFSLTVVVAIFLMGLELRAFG